MIEKLAPRITAILVASLSSVLLAGCAGIHHRIEEYASNLPRRYVIIAPEGRRELPAVREFVTTKEQDGLAVSFVEFSLDEDTTQRIRQVRDRLPELDDGPSYALIVASAEELPMGPWKVEGLEDPIESDLPLFLGASDPSETITEETWRRIDGSSPSWFVGRIPFSGPDRIAVALQAASRTDSAPPVALLGSERFAIWWDASLVMSRARQKFGDSWTTITYGEDGPADFRLGREYRGADDIEVLRDFPNDAFEDMEYGQDSMFVAHWAHTSPSIVYVISHGQIFFGVDVGDYLISKTRIDRWVAHSTQHGYQSTPRTPAVLVVAACQAGPPESEFLKRLFDGGWVRGVVASTELTHPTPLFAAIRAETDTASVLNSGLPLGVAHQVVRHSYLEDADDSLSFIFSRSVRAKVAQNLLGLTLYGDPAQRLPAGAREPGRPETR